MKPFYFKVIILQHHGEFTPIKSIIKFTFSYIYISLICVPLKFAFNISERGMDPTRHSVGSLFRAEQLGSRASLSWGRRRIWMGIQVYVCILLCLAKAFMCSLGPGHSLHSQSTLSHSTPHPRPPFLNFFFSPQSSHQCHSLHHWKFIMTTHWGAHDRKLLFSPL